MNQKWREWHQKKYEVSNFDNLYTFYYAGFNLRSTDLQAYIGLGQMDKLDSIIKKRNENYKFYHKYLSSGSGWKPKLYEERFVSNFASCYSLKVDTF